MGGKASTRLEALLGTFGNRVFVYVGLFQLLAIVYLPSLWGEFLYDDLVSIVENPDLRQPGQPWLLLRDHPTSLQFDRRPVGGLLTLINFQLSGLSPIGYRLVNLLLHWFCAIAITELAILLCRRERIPGGHLAAVSIAAIWALHPLNTMPVAYIYQRMELLMALFATLAFYAILRSVGGGGRRRAWSVLAWVCALLSLLSKEVSVLLPLAMISLERLYGDRSMRQLVAARWVFYGSLALAWGLLGLWFLGGERTAELSVDDRLSTPLGYFVTQCRELLGYLKLLLYPEPLVFYHTPVYPSHPLHWLPHFGLLVLLASLAIHLARTRRWLAWSLLAAVLILAPTSSFIPVPLEPSAEFRMYLPSAAGIAALFALAVWALRKLKAPPPVWGSALLVALLAGSILSHHRAHVYRSRIDLWVDTANKEPLNVRAWGNLVHALIDKGRAGDAAPAIAIVGQLWAEHGIGAAHWAPMLAGKAAASEDRLDEAEAFYRSAFTLAPEDAEVAGSLGVLLVRMERFEEALPLLESALVAGGTREVAGALAAARRERKLDREKL